MRDAWLVNGSVVDAVACTCPRRTVRGDTVYGSSASAAASYAIDGSNWSRGCRWPSGRRGKGAVNGTRVSGSPVVPGFRSMAVMAIVGLSIARAYATSLSVSTIPAANQDRHAISARAAGLETRTTRPVVRNHEAGGDGSLRYTRVIASPVVNRSSRDVSFGAGRITVVVPLAAMAISYSAYR